MKLNNVNGCNDISFGDNSILEGDRIPPLKSHGQALEEELFPWCLIDNRDALANLLRHFYHALAVSMANGQKMWVLAKLAYLPVLLCATL